MSASRRARALLVGFFLSASASLAASPADEEPTAPALPSDIPARRLNIDHFLAAGYNPLVGEYRTRISYRMRLGQSEELLWRDTFLSLGGQVRLNPSYTAVGPQVEWQPIAVFNLRALVDGFGFFGTLGQLQSYRSPLEEHSDALRNAHAASAYASTGWHAMLRPTLQAQVGPVAVQSISSLEYWDIRLRDGDTLWYDAGPDSLLPGRGWTLTEEINLVYLAGPLTLGTTFRYFLPLYAPEHFRPGEQAPEALNSNMRLGLLAAYTFFEGGYSRFHHPSVFLLAQWHLRHPYRTGVEVTQALPFVALGFSFQQDFVL